MTNSSYWEDQSFLSPKDHLIIGSGIVGLSTALELRKIDPKAQITVLEREFIPTGASTKNAGFACFGSPSELLSDLEILSEEEVFNLVEMRVKGLSRLRNRLGDSNINYKDYGSYELFHDKKAYLNCVEKLDYFNAKLKHIFPNKIYTCFNSPSSFGFPKNSYLIQNKYEGQLDTGLMMQNLLKICAQNNIQLLNGFNVTHFEKQNANWVVYSTKNEIASSKLYLCNNAFASKFLPKIDLKPARAQVLITKPIENLKIKGCFHLDQGYYYFRNINNRILFGGGRNLDFQKEETFEMNTSDRIQNKLEELLKRLITPNQPFEIEKRWSGIMGVGNTKYPVIKKLDYNLYCGIRMGGMGVALGSEIGFQLAQMQNNES